MSRGPHRNCHVFPCFPSQTFATAEVLTSIMLSPGRGADVGKTAEQQEEPMSGHLRAIWVQRSKKIATRGNCGYRVPDPWFSAQPYTLAARGWTSRP